jgi:hypothetical protein
MHDIALGSASWRISPRWRERRVLQAFRPLGPPGESLQAAAAKAIASNQDGVRCRTLFLPFQGNSRRSPAPQGFSFH